VVHLAWSIGESILVLAVRRKRCHNLFETRLIAGLILAADSWRNVPLSQGSAQVKLSCLGALDVPTVLSAWMPSSTLRIAVDAVKGLDFRSVRLKAGFAFADAGFGLGGNDAGPPTMIVSSARELH
jgi:hypothetical protein